MDKRDLIKELSILKEAENKLKEICHGPFSTKEEGEQFVKNNLESFNLLKNVKKRIAEIEWELMSEIEKLQHQEYLIELKNKFKEK